MLCVIYIRAMHFRLKDIRSMAFKHIELAESKEHVSVPYNIVK